ncbi:Uncharacterised protein [Bordetella pertussis]|nr:Uncharacterised protein [Bordetella pertussis]
MKRYERGVRSSTAMYRHRPTHSTMASVISTG